MGNETSVGSDGMFLPFVSAAVDLLYAECDPILNGRPALERHITVLATGQSSLFKVCDFIEAGAKGSLSFKHDFNLNYDILFEDRALFDFLMEYFPDSLAGKLGETLLSGMESGRIYEVSTYDMT